MKNPILALLILLLAARTANAATCTATVSANWGSAGTWSCGHVPTCGDSIIIPAGITVTIATQADYRNCGSPMKIVIYGSLVFTTGNKLMLPCNSLIYVMASGSVYPGNGGGNSNLIEICDVTLWNAAYGPILGSVVVSCCTPLPVELLYVETECRENGVQIEWATASETGNDFFTVERTDNTMQTEVIGTVDGAGNSSVTRYYSFFDPQLSGQTVYYRIRQTDFNGNSETSGYVVTECERKKGEISVFPVPAHDWLGLKETESGNTIRIYNTLGEEVLQILSSEGESSINVEALAPGIYFLRYSNASEIVFSEKIILI